MSVPPVAATGPAAGLTPAGVVAFIESFCHDGGVLVVRHYATDWPGSPPPAFDGAIEAVLEPFREARRRGAQPPARAAVVPVLGFIRGWQRYHVIAPPDMMPACGWEPANTRNTLYRSPPPPPLVNHNPDNWRVCRLCHAAMERATR